MKACAPIIPVEVGFIDQEIHPPDFEGVEMNAMEREALVAL